MLSIHVLSKQPFWFDRTIILLCIPADSQSINRPWIHIFCPCERDYFDPEIG